MQDPFDPDAMTPEERERELAELLATGYLRQRRLLNCTLHARNAVSACVSGPEEGGRQPESEVDARANRSVNSPPGNRLEALKGELRGLHSIRVNDQWRIVCRWTPSGPAEVDVRDYH